MNSTLMLCIAKVLTANNNFSPTSFTSLFHSPPWWNACVMWVNSGGRSHLRVSIRDAQLQELSDEKHGDQPRLWRLYCVVSWLCVARWFIRADLSRAFCIFRSEINTLLWLQSVIFKRVLKHRRWWKSFCEVTMQLDFPLFFQASVNRFNPGKRFCENVATIFVKQIQKKNRNKRVLHKILKRNL